MLFNRDIRKYNVIYFASKLNQTNTTNDENYVLSLREFRVSLRYTRVSCYSTDSTSSADINNKIST